MRKSQLFGLLLWRAGLLLAGSYGTFRVARITWDHWSLPPQLDWGLAFLATGAAFVAGSFVAERLHDRSIEGSFEE